MERNQSKKGAKLWMKISHISTSYDYSVAGIEARRERRREKQRKMEE
jgi:hypothetical protein